ncbi:alpha-ketoglutarate-dependent dioxygenase AlkB [Sphingomonas floccifaciens]|uniref:Alpha-ketoglutarate-dependent dioxygenase AlkB n=1 Tax=Sphingomonas floccifaciens TaxID=1844115 RepID=A0ABW4NB78_9SPHN
MSGLLDQGDLFAPPLVPGLTYTDNIIDTGEEAALIAHIDAAPLTPFRFQQWLGKRLTASYGWSYDFATGAFAAAEAIPDWLHPIRARAAAIANLPADDLAQVLLIRYDPGAGIGWHRDRPVFEHVVGVSLGALATLRLRVRNGASFRRAARPLAPRSIYHLSGEARHAWEHSIAPIDEPRWSITFRSLAGGGRRR